MASRGEGYAENPESPSEDGGLSAFEIRIAQLLFEGCGPTEIAERLRRRETVIHYYLRRMYRKAGLSDARAQIVQLALLLHEQRAILGIRCQACGEM